MVVAAAVVLASVTMMDAVVDVVVVGGWYW
jgi:hypothetical protein